ncbi:MAG: hypothetical protein ACMV1B_05920 [Prevotella sp.]
MFDINGARQAGYSENEIADFMAQQRGFNISGAREAGYSDNEILAHLDSLQSTDRSFKEIGLDTVKQLGVGVGSTIEGLGTVGMLLGSDRAKSMKDLGNKITEDLRGSYSQGLKNNISEQQQYINEADGEASKFWRTIESTATNPALLATFIAESAPQMLAGGVVGRGVGAGAKLLGAGEALAGKMAIGGAMGTGAVLQGADSASNTYDTLMKLDDGVWSQNQQFKALVEQGADPLQAKDEISKSLARKTLATSGAISLATQGAFSKIGGNAFERALVGQAEKGTVGGIAGKALAEAGSEAIEEGSGQGASNYNVNQVTPTSLFKNVGQSAGQGAITGFSMGGFGGAVEAFKPMTQLVEEEKAKIQAESGNVNAVNNSFNVFGDLAQRSDAINPNIGDINYNQFTQSVDNTTTTPTNTVNVPNVDTQTTQAQEVPTQEAVSKMETTETPQVNNGEAYFKEEIQTLNKRQLIAKIETIEQEQQKREKILSSDKTLEDYAIDKGISKEAMKELISSNYADNKNRLAYYKKELPNTKEAEFKKVSWNDITDSDTSDELAKANDMEMQGATKEQAIRNLVYDVVMGKHEDFNSEAKLAKANAMEKQAMQNGDLETAKKISEAKQGMVKDLADKDLERLQQHPRYDKLLDMRKDISAKDTQYSKKLANKRGTDANGEWYGATYEDNHASDFELTKADVKALQNGKATPKTIQKLRNDLGRLDNDPQYKLPEDEQQANDGLLFSKEPQAKMTKKQLADMDKEYFKAIEDGDMAKVQKMVEDYAKFKGYSKDNTFDKMEHKAPYNDGYSKPLHDMTDIYPDDIYTHGVQYYGDGVHYDRLAIDIMKKVRGNPDARIRVYRAVPKDLKETKLRDGDWITISREYAKEHGENNLDGKYKIIEQMVLAKHVFTDGNSIHEQGYDSGSNSTYKNNVKGNRKDLSPIIKLYDNENDGAEYIQPLSKRFNEKEEADFYSKGKSKGTTADKATKIVNKLLGNSKVRQDVEVVQSFDNLPNDIKKRMELMSIVYHGTPNNVDKFSTKYIGTGEGVQAYGWGMYFADSKEVAEWYRDTLKPYGHDNFIIDGKAYDRNDLTTAEVYAIRDILKDGYEQALETNEKWVKSKTNPKDIDLATLDAIKRLKGLSIKENKGNLYRVDLKPKEEEYLLWDKPLIEQSNYVLQKLGIKNISEAKEWLSLRNELISEYGIRGMKNAPKEKYDRFRELGDKIQSNGLNYSEQGSDLYFKFKQEFNSDKKASEHLHSLGIRGIKYKDADSRLSKDGNSHNYVIFNDEDVGIPELLQSADGVVRGVFDPKTNKAYLVADTMAENEVKGVLLHELLHRAINNEVKRQSDKQGQTVSRLDAILGSKLEQVTADLKSLEAKGDKDVLEAVNKAKEAGTPKQHMLEETLAYLLQNQTNKYSTPLKEFLLKVATAIKDFAKRVAVKMGIEPNWLASQITADDIANVLKSYALDDGSAKTSGEPMMSKISDRMKRLMEWHKDSSPETKNEDGTPKVFYHGTNADFNIFDMSKARSSSKAKPSDLGFWFTSSADYAENHGNSIMQVYTNIKNPKIYTKDNFASQINKTDFTQLREQLKAQGYDGVVVKGGKEKFAGFDVENPDNIVAFEPTQIKSIHNKGTFDESNPNILFSRTDDVKKLAKQARSKAKQFLSDQLNKTALERSIDMLSKPKDEAYSAFKSLVMNTLPQKYMDALGEMHKSKNRIEQQVGVVKASLSTLSLEQRTQLHDYIVNDVKTIDPELKKLADKISGIITNLGQELINQGILEAHVVKAWEGKFLKRQFKNEEAVLGTSKFKTYFFGSKKSLAKQYTRGLQLQAETEAEAIKAINGYLKAYGHDEISGMGVNDAIKYLKDNGLFADGVQWKSDGKIKVREMKNGEYEIIRDFTKAEREKMEEVTDAGITVPDTILRLSTLLEHGKMLKATTELNDYVTDDKTMGNSMKWTQIENKPQYGVLAGKWVRPDIASDIIANQNAFYERDGLVDTWLKGLSLWKKSRTVWSPTGHFNNFVSNLFIKHGLGLDPFKNTLEAGKMLSQLQEYEALEVKDAMGTLTAEEQTKFNTMKSYLSSVIELRDNGMLGHTQLLDINRGFEQDGITEEKGALGKLDDAVSKLYKGGDTIHRLSSYMLIKEAGYDSETAMLVVDKLFPDYSKPMPKVWRWARDTGISPFISWTYYTLPAISKITMANPARTLGAYSALGAIGFLGMLLGSDGDWEEAIQSFLNLPEDAIGRRMPIWKNDKGEVLTWKVDRLMPFMDLASPLLGMASGAVKGYKESQGDVGHTAIKAVSGGFGGAGNTVRSYFAGPTINALLFNTAGKDSYTNNDIVKKDATDKQRMYLTAKYLVEQYAPLPTPLMRMYDMTEAMVKGEDERKRNAITVPRSPIENVIGLAGINVLRYDQKALDKQMKDFSAEAQDFTEIKQKLIKLDGMLKESKERKDIDTYNKIISKHQDEMRTLGDLKKTETQLRKLKSMRDEAMMSSDDKAVLELNKQINQIMKAFNERNKK